MTAYYIAANRASAPYAAFLARALRDAGQTMVDGPVGVADPAQQAAIDALAPIRACEVFIVLAGPSFQPRPGTADTARHVEFGYALGLGKRLVCIGRPDTPAHVLPGVERFDTLEAFLSSVPPAAPARCDIERQGDEEFCRTCARRWDAGDEPPCGASPA